LGTAIATEPFTDLDFADDVALLTEMLSVLALEIMNYEAYFLGLQDNCLKTIDSNYRRLLSRAPLCHVRGDNVEIVESFTYP